MDAKRSFQWTGYYFGLTAVATLLGLALVVAGAKLGATEVYHAAVGDGSTLAALESSAPGVALAVLGVAVWWFGKAWAMYLTLTAAVEDELSETYDTERVKSEILSVIDERLADIQQDLQSVPRRINEAAETGDDPEFEFDQ